MSSSIPPPSPVHLIRAHKSPVNVVAISDDNERIYSGDSSGLVVVTSTRSLRSLASWNAHTDGLLGIQEWADQILTHGRDNKLHVWGSPVQGPSSLGESAALPGLPSPILRYSLDVNALNYCRFSLLPIAGEQTNEPQALIAVPNLVESSLADIWSLPSRERLHAAIGKGGLEVPVMPGTDGRGVRNATGIIMSMHLLPAESTSPGGLSLLTSYENGSVAMWQYRNTQKERSIEGLGWERCWSSKLHVESVMAFAVSLDRSLAFSVSADHLIGRYDLDTLRSNPLTVTACSVHRTKHPGNATIALRDDARICAVGGWDGKIRLYSTKSSKPLGTLLYHKDAVQTLAFARSNAASDTVVDEDDEEDEMSNTEKISRRRWLVSGGKDGRVAIWELIDFVARQ